MSIVPAVRSVTSLFLGPMADPPVPPIGGERPTIEAAVRDDAGNTFVTGTFTAARTKVGGVDLLKSPASRADLFVALLDRSGAALWVVNFGSLRSPVKPVARAIAIDGAGTVFVAGSYDGGSFDDLNLPAADEESGFVLRLGMLGGVEWTAPVMQGRLVVGDMALDAAAKALFLSGAAGGGTRAQRPGGQSAEGVVARLDSASGSVQWLRRIPGAGGNPRGQAIVLDGDSRHLYLAGDISTAAMLPPTVQSNRDGRFILRLDYAGGDVDAIEGPITGR